MRRLQSLDSVSRGVLTAWLRTLHFCVTGSGVGVGECRCSLMVKKEKAKIAGTACAYILHALRRRPGENLIFRSSKNIVIGCGRREGKHGHVVRLQVLTDTLPIKPLSNTRLSSNGHPLSESSDDDLSMGGMTLCCSRNSISQSCGSVESKFSSECNLSLNSWKFLCTDIEFVSVRLWYTETLIHNNAMRPLLHTYNSSLPAVAFLPSASQTAGVPTSILYTHLASSIIFHSSFSSLHARMTIVLRLGPFQQC